ncbi:MAG: hypothetical protein MRY63_05750 [Neomegalonema sp.]|nr:hypothetical protein [Neomegalonema sp.]
MGHSTFSTCVSAARIPASIAFGVTLGLSALLAAPATAQELPAPAVWELHGFEAPESVLVDTQRNRLIVSNINGHPGAVDGNGYLSLASLDGKMIEQHWVEGLDAPKGMAISGDALLVADLTQLVVIDLPSGTITARLAPEGAVFLNDATTAADGSIFVSDFVGGAIYRYADGAVSEWLRAPDLHHPNGLLAEGGTLLIGSWGQDMQADFSTLVPGKVLAADLRSKVLRDYEGSDFTGNVDGLVRLAGDLVISDWISGKLTVEKSDGAEQLSLRPGLADIGGAGTLVFAPFMNDGAIAAYRID